MLEARSPGEPSSAPFTPIRPCAPEGPPPAGSSPPARRTRSRRLNATARSAACCSRLVGSADATPSGSGALTPCPVRSPNVLRLHDRPDRAPLLQDLRLGPRDRVLADPELRGGDRTVDHRRDARDVPDQCPR